MKIQSNQFVARFSHARGSHFGARLLVLEGIRQCSHDLNRVIAIFLFRVNFGLQLTRRSNKSLLSCVFRAVVSRIEGLAVSRNDKTGGGNMGLDHGFRLAPMLRLLVVAEHEVFANATVTVEFVMDSLPD